MVPEEDERADSGLSPGTLIANRFRIQHKLGEGGMGTVYAAVNLTTNRSVALKVMHPQYAAKKDVVRRFTREAKAATVITHPNVIEVLDLVEGMSGEPVMVMELLDGEPLDALLERRGALALAEVARIMTPVVSAVGAAHAHGIIHRDLKPENIFLARTPDGQLKPKVLDFGIAKILDPTQINEGITKSGGTRTGSMLGTPYYMSIEQACGEKDIDHRTDIWSIGVILYVMLSGRRPFDGENYGQILKGLMTDSPPPVQSLAPGLPSDVAEIVTRCMSRARAERPSDLREVYSVLSPYCDAIGIAPPSSATVPLATNDAASQTLAAASVYTNTGTTSGTGLHGPRKALWMVAAPAVALALAFGTFVVVRAFRTPAQVSAGADPVPILPVDPAASVASASAGPSSSSPGGIIMELPSAYAPADSSASQLAATGRSPAPGSGKAKPREASSAAPPPSAAKSGGQSPGIIQDLPSTYGPH